MGRFLRAQLSRERLCIGKYKDQDLTLPLMEGVFAQGVKSLREEQRDQWVGSGFRVNRRKLWTHIKLRKL